MMPIVEPCAELSKDICTLDAYLGNTGPFHVLRMVAMQQQQSMSDALLGLEYLNEVATTRGSGGLPNAVVVYCDLSCEASLSQLLESEHLSRVRGVHFKPLLSHDFKQAADQRTADLLGSPMELPQSLLKNIALLQANELSLDLTLSVSEYGFAKAIAEQYPELLVAVTISDWTQWLGSDRVDSFKSKLDELALNQNTHLKISLGEVSLDDSLDSTVASIISLSLGAFTNSRILFSSSSQSQKPALTFEQQWNCFFEASVTFSAKAREAMFRANAMRLYRL